MSSQSLLLLSLFSFLLFNIPSLRADVVSRACDFSNYASCTNPKYIINRLTGYYLGQGSGYPTGGFNTELDYNYQKYCINNCFITNMQNFLVLDVAESDLVKKQPIFWFIHPDDSGNQAWLVTLEATGFYSIRTYTFETLLALSSVDFDPANGLTLMDYDVNDTRQQWIIQE